jgi:hypothetical protein
MLTSGGHSLAYENSLSCTWFILIAYTQYPPYKLVHMYKSTSVLVATDGRTRRRKETFPPEIIINYNYLQHSTVPQMDIRQCDCLRHYITSDRLCGLVDRVSGC